MRCAAAPWGRLAAAGTLLFVFHGCTPTPPPAREYEWQGQILALEPATREVLITHGDLAAWRGSAVAVTFINTRGPLPQFCPLMDRRFAGLQQLAKSDPELNGQVRLLAVSFDRDTACLVRGYDSNGWTAPQIASDLRTALASR